MLPIVKIQVWKRAKEGVPGTQNDQRPSQEDRGGLVSDEQVIGSCRTSLIQSRGLCGVRTLTVRVPNLCQYRPGVKQDFPAYSHVVSGFDVRLVGLHPNR